MITYNNYNTNHTVGLKCDNAIACFRETKHKMSHILDFESTLNTNFNFFSNYEYNAKSKLYYIVILF